MPTTATRHTWDITPSRSFPPQTQPSLLPAKVKLRKLSLRLWFCIPRLVVSHSSPSCSPPALAVAGLSSPPWSQPSPGSLPSSSCPLTWFCSRCSRATSTRTAAEASRASETRYGPSSQRSSVSSWRLWSCSARAAQRECTGTTWVRVSRKSIAKAASNHGIAFFIAETTTKPSTSSDNELPSPWTIKNSGEWGIWGKRYKVKWYRLRRSREFSFVFVYLA